MEDVRGAGSKKGLSYAASAPPSPAYKHGGLVRAGGSTKNVTVGETVGVIKNEFGNVYRDGITQPEMDDAKVYLTGSAGAER